MYPSCKMEFKALAAKGAQPPLACILYSVILYYARMHHTVWHCITLHESMVHNIPVDHIIVDSVTSQFITLYYVCGILQLHDRPTQCHKQTGASKCFIGFSSGCWVIATWQRVWDAHRAIQPVWEERLYGCMSGWCALRPCQYGTMSVCDHVSMWPCLSELMSVRECVCAGIGQGG